MGGCDTHDHIVENMEDPLVSRAADSTRMASPLMKPTDLLPAQLKDGRYAKPYVLLEIEQLWAGQCDNRTRSRRPPSTSRYHIMIDGGVAACRPFRPSHQWVCYNAVLIGVKSLIPIGSVPTQQICRRNGCLQIYEAYLG